MTTSHHSIVELIERKRDGGELSAQELEWLVREFTADRLPDYQMAPLLMAIFFAGMTPDELAPWTEAMLRSGEVLDLSGVTAPKIDKHSTGGVGDKVSIPLAPMVAACGVAIPMVSGRGLGHTGGTLDKLESIPGFRTAIEPGDFASLLGRTGLVFAGQTETLVPADKRIYALRDTTGTVPSVPLIASSIMSKKLAEDLDGLVLDVKVGWGAFMRDESSARRLAATMVSIGKAHGTPTIALLTDMNQPLGREVGNASEIRESLAVLRGDGPADVNEVTFRLGIEMLRLGGLAGGRTEARERLERSIASGAALDVFARVIEAQGGDPRIVDDESLLPSPAHVWELTATREGIVTECDPLGIGNAVVRLGGGRERKEDVVDPAVGVTVLAKVGDHVSPGQPLALVGYNHEAQLDNAREVLESAWVVSDGPAPSRPLIIGEVR